MYVKFAHHDNQLFELKNYSQSKQFFDLNISLPLQYRPFYAVFATLCNTACVECTPVGNDVLT